MSPNSEFPADLVLFTEEILDGKLHFLCSAIRKSELVEVSFISRSHLCWQVSTKIAAFYKLASTFSLFCSIDQTSWENPAKVLVFEKLAAFNFNFVKNLQLY